MQTLTTALQENFMITAIFLILFALGLFAAKLIYGIQLHRRASKTIAELNTTIRTLDDLDTRR